MLPHAPHIDQMFAALSARLQGPLQPFAPDLVAGPRARRSALNRLIVRLHTMGHALHAGTSASGDEWREWWTVLEAATRLKGALWGLKAGAGDTFITEQLDGVSIALDRE